MGNKPSSELNSPIILLQQAEKSKEPKAQPQFDALEKGIQLLFPVQHTKSNQKDAQVNENDEMFTHWFTQLLGQRGLQNSEDVKKFFATEEGRRLKKQLEEMLNAIAAREQAARDREYYEQLTRHCLLAFLHFYFLQHKRELAKKTNESIQQQIDKILAKGRELINTKSGQPQASDFAVAFTQPFEAYQISAEIIKNDLVEQLAHAEAIEGKLAKLENQEQIITERYQALEYHSNVLLSHLRVIEQAEFAEQTNLVKAKKAELILTIEAKQKEINAMLDSNKPEAEANAYRKLHELNGLNLEYAGLEDMEAVLDGKKVLYNADGKPVDSINQAEFILPKDQAIIKHNSTYYLLKPEITSKLVNNKVLAQDSHGQLYLINPSATLNALSHDEKDLAKRMFERAKPSISSLKKLVVDNHGLEVTNCTNQKSALAIQSQQAREVIAELSNQLNQVQAAQANLVDLIKNPKLGGPNPLRMPIPKPIQNFSKLTHSLSASQKFKIFCLANKQNVTQEVILILKKGFFENKMNMRLAEMQRLNADINKLEPGKPIPPSTLALLLRNCNLFSTSPLNLENIREPKPAGPFSINPFKTKPFPF